MSRKNPKAGEGPCPVCARTVFFRASPSGKLTYACDGCDTSGFADPGGEGHKKWSASITKTTPEPAPAPGPAATPAPAPRKPASAFNLANL